MTVANWLSIFGLSMDIVGAYFLISGFFGKKYGTMMRETQSTFDYNKAAFTNVVDQKASALTGFSILILGFLEQIVANFPIASLLSESQIIAMGFSLSIIIVGFLVWFKEVLTNFYVGLLAINWEYHGKIEQIPSQIVRDVIQKSNTQGFQSVQLIEKRGRFNVKLLWAVSKIGKTSRKRD